MLDMHLSGLRLPNLLVVIDAQTVQRGDCEDTLPLGGVIMVQVGNDDGVGVGRQHRGVKRGRHQTHVGQQPVDVAARNQIITPRVVAPFQRAHREADCGRRKKCQRQ